MKTIQTLVLALFLSALAAHAAEISWTGRTVIPDRRTGAGPALAVFDGKLLMVYKGEKSPNLYQTDYDGRAWGGETRIPSINTRDTPALLVQGDTLHCIYVGEKKPPEIATRYGVYKKARAWRTVAVYTLPEGRSHVRENAQEP